MIGSEAICVLYPRPKAHVNTRKKLKFSWMPSGIVPSPKAVILFEFCQKIHHVANRKFAGSIPGCVSGFFIDKILPIALWIGVDSASNRNEYQKYFLGVKAAGA